MNRLNFLRVATTATAGILASAANASAVGGEKEGKSVASRPKMLFFDVNETLLDLTAMKASVGAALGGRAELLPLWFTTMLQYSLVATVGDHYEDFGVIGAAAMQMVARNHGIELSQEAAREAMKPIRTLPPHPEVKAALQQLKDAGYRLVTFTNSSQAAVDAQIENAGLTALFEARLAVSDIQIFKPHGHAYRWAARKMGLQPAECLLVAAHGWDIAGALWAGWRGAFISRPGAQLYPLAPAPEIAEVDLTKVAARLVALEK